MTRIFYLLPVFLAFSACKKDQVRFTLEIPDGRHSYLALGDSYTIGQGVAQHERWPNQLVDALGEQGILFQRPRIVAKTGWRTDQLQAAIDTIKRKDWALVTLLIGVNDYYQNWPVQAFVPKFAQTLDSAIALAGNTKSHVLVLSIPDYGYTPFGAGNQAIISAGINTYNTAIATLCDQKEVTFVSITDISQGGLANPDLVATDGLHPSGKQYELWVERLLTFSFFERYR